MFASKIARSATLSLAVAAVISSIAVPATAGVTIFGGSEDKQQVQLPDFVKLVEDNGPGVVNIQMIRNARTVENAGIPGLDPRGAEIFRRFGIPFDFGPQEIPEQRGTGSGFIVSSDGIIMTNAHVVEGADELIVRLTDKREFKGKVLGSDKQTDIAVIKIDADGLTPAIVGDSDKLAVGDNVLAVGNPLGELGSPFGLDNTVTAGIVSALSRNLPSDQYVPFIQTDVAVNPGNSGGPLFNMQGEVVGINSQIFSTSGGFMGLSFAIPIDLAMQIKDQLVKDGRVTRGYVGVFIQEINQELADSLGLKTPEGALVTKTEKDSPAEKAGLRERDVILALNGKKVTSSVTLPSLVSTIRPGTEVTMTVFRDGKEQEIKVTVGSNKATEEKQATAANETRLGVTTRPLTKEEEKKAETTGLLVTQASGPAAKAGIRAGDILVSADGKLLKSRDDLLEQCKDNKVLLLVQRNGGRIFIPVKLQAKK